MPGFVCKSWPLVACRRALLAVKQATKAWLMFSATPDSGKPSRFAAPIALMLRQYFQHRCTIQQSAKQPEIEPPKT